VTPWTSGAERGDGGEDDVGLDLTQAVEVDRQRAQHFGRQVGDHDVGPRHQLADDGAAVGRDRVERHRALVPVHDQEHRSHVVVAYRGDPPVLAAAQALDADDVGSEIGEQSRTVRPCDVPSKIKDPNSR
jgi:hypothetical protein